MGGGRSGSSACGADEGGDRMSVGGSSGGGAAGMVGAREEETAKKTDSVGLDMPAGRPDCFYLFLALEHRHSFVTQVVNAVRSCCD